MAHVKDEKGKKKDFTGAAQEAVRQAAQAAKAVAKKQQSAATAAPAKQNTGSASKDQMGVRKAEAKTPKTTQSVQPDPTLIKGASPAIYKDGRMNRTTAEILRAGGIDPRGSWDNNRLGRYYAFVDNVYRTYQDALMSTTWGGEPNKAKIAEYEAKAKQLLTFDRSVHAYIEQYEKEHGHHPMLDMYNKPSEDIIQFYNVFGTEEHQQLYADWLKDRAEIMPQFESEDAYNQAVSEAEKQQAEYDYYDNYDDAAADAELAKIEAYEKDPRADGDRINVKISELMSPPYNFSEEEARKRADKWFAEELKAVDREYGYSDISEAYARREEIKAEKYRAAQFRQEKAAYEKAKAIEDDVRGRADFAEGVRQGKDDFEDLRKKNPKNHIVGILEDQDLTDEERETLFYLYKDMGDELDSYYEAIKGSLNRREAERMSSAMQGHYFQEMAFGLPAGLDQFRQGILNWAKGDDYIEHSSYQIASAAAREDLASFGPQIGGRSLGQISYDMITTTANMIPSIAAGAAADMALPGSGRVLSALMMGGSAGGQAYAEMINAGFSRPQATVYGLLNGSLEAGLEYALNGIAALGKSPLVTFFQENLSKVANVFSKGFLKYATNFVGDTVSEGVEEFLQDVIDPFVWKTITGEWKRDDNGYQQVGVDWDEAIYSGLLGMLSAVPFNVTTGAARNAANYGTVLRAIKNGDLNTLIELGKAFEEDTGAYRLADAFDAEAGKYGLRDKTRAAMMVDEISSALGEDINAVDSYYVRNALTEAGVTGDALDVMTEVVTEAIKNGESSPAGRRALRRLNLDIDGKDAVQIAYETAKKVSDVKSERSEAINAFLKNRSPKSAETVGINRDKKKLDYNRAVAENAKTTAENAQNKMLRNAMSRRSILDYGVDMRTLNETRVDTARGMEPTKIVSNEDGFMQVQLAGGKVADSADIKYPTAEAALLYESMRKNNVDAEDANRMIKSVYINAMDGASVPRQLGELFRVYGDGMNGNAAGKTRWLTERQRVIAYEAGKRAAGEGKRPTVHAQSVQTAQQQRNTQQTSKAGRDAENRFRLGVISEMIGTLEGKERVSPDERATLRVLRIERDRLASLTESGTAAEAAPEREAQTKKRQPKRTEPKTSKEEAAQTPGAAEIKATADGKKTTVSGFGLSKDGGTLLDADGKPISIDSTEFAGERGEETKRFAEAIIARMQNRKNAWRLTKESADAALSEWLRTPDADPEAFASEWYAQYAAGAAGVSKKQAARLNVREHQLSDAQMKTAWETGNRVSDVAPGVMLITENDLTKTQRAALEVLDGVAGKHGLSIVVVDRIYSDGRLADVNGFREGSVLVLALETGAGDVKSENLLTLTAYHEAFHLLEQGGEAGRQFKSFLIDSVLSYLKETLPAADYERLFTQREAAYWQDRALLREEIAAQYLGALMAAKENAEIERRIAEKLADSGNLSRWEKFVEKMKAFLADMRAGIARLAKRDSAVAAALGTGADAAEMFVATFERALETVKNKTPAENGGVDYSIDYINAEENKKLKTLLNRVNTGNANEKESVQFGIVDNKTATDIFNEIGVHAEGFKIIIEARQLQHILEDHGINGKADHTLANDSDILKMGFVIDNYESITKAGRTRAYWEFTRGHNRTARTIKLEKTIGEKSYYVIEAVPDTKARTIYVVSAYLGPKTKKAGASQLGNTNSPATTSGIATAITPTNNISQDSDISQDNKTDFSKDLSVVATERDEQYLAAVESGDMETAQRMVDEAAKRAGYTKVGEYYIKNEIVPNNIKPTKNQKYFFDLGGRLARENNTTDERELLLAMENDDLENLAMQESAVFDRFFKAGIRDNFPEYRLAIRFGEIPENYRSRNWATNDLERGVSAVNWLDENSQNEKTLYDVIYGLQGTQKIIVGGWDFGIYGSDGEPLVVFPEKITAADDLSKIKLAKITYDADGNVIPLSERFDETRDDIRYSKNLDIVAEETLERQSGQREEVLEQTEILRDKAAKLSDENMDESTLRALLPTVPQVQKLLGKRNFAALSERELVEQAGTVRKMTENLYTGRTSFAGYMTDLTRLLQTQVENAGHWEDAGDGAVRDFKKQARGAKIYLAPDIFRTVAENYGGRNGFRRAVMGKFWVTDDAGKGGQGLDTFYDELRENGYRDLLTETTDPGTQIGNLLAAFRMGQQVWVDDAKNNEWFGETAQEIAREEAYSLFAALTEATPTAKKLSADDAAGRRIQALNEQLRAERRAAREEALAEARSIAESRAADLKHDADFQIAKARIEAEERVKAAERLAARRIADAERLAARQKEADRLKADIRRKVRSLNKLLIQNANYENVPESAKRAVTGLLTLFSEDRDIYSVREINDLSFEYKRILKGLDDDFTEDADETEKGPESYAAFAAKLDGEIGAELADMLDALTKQGGAVAEGATRIFLRGLTPEQARTVMNAVDNIAFAVRNANLVRIGERKAEADALGMQAEIELSKKSRKVRGQGADAVIDYAATKMLTPIYFFKEKLGGVFGELYEPFLDGQDSWARKCRQAADFMTETKEKFGFKKWKKETRDFLFQSDNVREGWAATLPVGACMEIYAWKKREESSGQESAHLLTDTLTSRTGGLVLSDDIEKAQKKNLKKIRASKNEDYVKFLESRDKTNDAVVDKNRHKLTEGDIQQIVDSLTDEQKAYVDAVVGFLSTETSGWGNEATMRQYGIRKFTEGYYFPFETPKEFTNRRFGLADDTRLKSWGSAKKTVRRAHTPLVLGDFTQVATAHMQEMALYSSFLTPIETMQTVFNFRQKDGTTSVAAALTNAYGKAATEYINSFLTAINGGLRSDSVDAIYNRMVGKFKAAAVMGNASVVIQQPTAIMRATALLNPKYFFGAAKIRDYREMLEHCPTAVVKEMGGFDTSMGVSAAEWIMGEETRTEKIGKVMGWGAEKADAVTWTNLWNAVKRETKAKTDLAYGSDEFWDACNKRFREIANYTQVYDSALAKSELMRSKGGLAKMVTAFMAEPTLSYNLLVMSGKNKTISKSRALTAFTLSVILNVAMQSIVGAWRDKDEDETYWEKYAETASGNLLGNKKSWFMDSALNPLGLVPWVKDLISIFGGWDVDRADVSVFSELIKSGTKLVQAATEGKLTLKLVMDFGAAASAFTPIPLKSIYKDLAGILRVVKIHTKDDLKTDRATLAQAFLEGIGMEKDQDETAYFAVLHGDAEVIRRRGRYTKADIQKYIDQGYSERDAEEKAKQAAYNEWHGHIRKGLKACDKRVTAAADAFEERRYADYEKLVQEVKKDGFTQTDVTKAVKMILDERAEKKAKPFEPDENQPLFKKGDLAEPIAADDLNAFNELSEALKTESGLEQKEIDSAAKSAVKDLYKGGEIDGDTATKYLTKYAGQSGDDAYWTLREWSWNEDLDGDGNVDEYHKYDEFVAAFDAGKDLEAVIKEYLDHGAKPTGMADALTDKYKPIYTSEDLSAEEKGALKEKLLEAYVALGFKYKDRNTAINNWKPKEKDEEDE